MSHIENDKEKRQNRGRIILNIIRYSFFLTEIVLLFYFFQQGYIIGWKGILLAFLYVLWSVVCMEKLNPSDFASQGGTFFIIEILLSRHMFMGNISKIICSVFIMVIGNLIVKMIIGAIRLRYDL